MELHQQRVVEELKELDNKRESLIAFMHSNTYFELDAVNQGLLMVQLVAMNNYSETLDRRIELF